eukprot:scaffold278627_cov23-Tisochrysis_lutea.AAC.2
MIDNTFTVQAGQLLHVTTCTYELQHQTSSAVLTTRIFVTTNEHVHGSLQTWARLQWQLYVLFCRRE